MRNSIKIFLLVFTAILFTGSLFAQGHHKKMSPEERATKMTERMTTSLKLSDAQASKVKEVFLKFGERKEAMRSQKETGNREEMKTAMRQIRKDFDKEMQTILTSEQFKEFQNMPRPSHRKGFRDRANGKRHKAFHNEKIKPIMLEQRAKLESKISDEDKATIAQLRVDLKKERLERKNLKNSAEKRANKEERKKRRVEREKDPNHVKLVELTEKYSADIEPLLAKVKEELKAIKKESKIERKGKQRGHKKGKACDGCDDSKKKKHEDRKAHHKNRKYSHFLLLDPNKKPEQAEKTSFISDVKVYPNPSQGISQIEYQLKTPGKVLIELRDKEGNLLDLIENTQKSAGAHKTAVDFGKYTVGIYYLVLKDEQGNTVSKKVIR